MISPSEDDAARAELQATKAALVECIADLRSTCEDLGNTMTQLAAAKALLQKLGDEDQSRDGDVRAAVNAYFAGQTAAPDPLDPVASKMLELQTRIEAAQARPAAEQRVLDAMAEVSFVVTDAETGRLGFAFDDEADTVLRAERSRRGPTG